MIPFTLIPTICLTIGGRLSCSLHKHYLSLNKCHKQKQSPLHENVYFIFILFY